MVELRNQYRPDTVSPPGATLQDALQERSMSQAELASRTGRPKKTVNEIIQGKTAITPDTAVELEQVLGIPARFWLAREQNYREHLARTADRSRLQRHTDWLKELPVAELVRNGWIRKFRDKTSQVQECLRFFGVVSPEDWARIYGAPAAQFRRSTAFDVDAGAVAAWLRAGEIAAQAVAAAPYEKAKFREALSHARTMTTEDVATFLPELKRAFATAGVALVVIREVKRCRASGATKWLASDKAVMQLSLRYQRDDHFWFTLFHEAGHILKHGKKEVFLEGDQHVGDLEEEANRFAADFLIPTSAFRELQELGPPFSKKAVEKLAGSISIAPGIVVGRLQHEGLLPRTHLNGLRRRLDWDSVPLDEIAVSAGP